MFQRLAATFLPRPSLFPAVGLLIGLAIGPSMSARAAGPAPAVPKGSLVIAGGALRADNATVWKTIVDLAGGRGGPPGWNAPAAQGNQGGMVPATSVSAGGTLPEAPPSVPATSLPATPSVETIPLPERDVSAPREAAPGAPVRSTIPNAGTPAQQ